MVFFIIYILLAIDPIVYIFVVKKDGAENNLWPFSGYLELYRYFSFKNKVSK